MSEKTIAFRGQKLCDFIYMPVDAQPVNSTPKVEYKPKVSEDGAEKAPVEKWLRSQAFEQAERAVRAPMSSYTRSRDNSYELVYLV